MISGLGRFPGEGNGNPLQYSCLENSKDRGAWRATIHGVAESDMTERLTLPLLLSESGTVWRPAPWTPGIQGASQACPATFSHRFTRPRALEDACQVFLEDWKIVSAQDTGGLSRLSLLVHVLLKQTWLQFYGERSPPNTAALPWRSLDQGFQQTARAGESDAFIP